MGMQEDRGLEEVGEAEAAPPVGEAEAVPVAEEDRPVAEEDPRVWVAGVDHLDLA